MPLVSLGALKERRKITELNKVLKKELLKTFQIC